MKEKEQDINLQGHEELNQHSLVCNNELFNKDLLAIVDDTMQEEG
ncbi:hypothetical protein ACFWDG_13915 [Peribacillus sp. NPDC060186]